MSKFGDFMKGLAGGLAGGLPGAIFGLGSSKQLCKGVGTQMI